VTKNKNGVERPAYPRGVTHDRIEHGLEIRRRTRDHAQDLACCRLLLPRLGQFAIVRLKLPQRLLLTLYSFSLALQRFRQSFLKVADLADGVFGRLADEGPLGFRLSLLGLCPAIHQALLASQGDRSTIG